MVTNSKKTQCATIQAFQSTNRHRLPWIYTVVTLTAPWYCGRIVGYLYKMYYINVDVY